MNFYDFLNNAHRFTSTCANSNKGNLLDSVDVIHTNRKSILKVGNIFENASRESIRNNAEIITIFQVVGGERVFGR